MLYRLIDREGYEIKNEDLQNRPVWYDKGQRKEIVFVQRYGNEYNVKINPEKAKIPTLPDLIHNGDLADLKCQNTPFFIAKKYKINPQYAVTFNLKDAFDYGEYGNNYKNLTIFFWVDWVAIKMIYQENTYEVKPMTGVWKAPFEYITQIRKTSQIHWYNQRNKYQETDPRMRKILGEFELRLKNYEGIYSIRGSNNNAACSYVLNLQLFQKII